MDYNTKLLLIKLNTDTKKDLIKSTYNYRKCAKTFQLLIKQIIKQILTKHNYSIFFSLNGVKLLSEGSVVNSSTAIGYIIEEFVSKEIKNSKDISSLFNFPIKTSYSAYDIKLNNNNIDLFCNIKAEKQGEYKKSKKLSGKNQNKGVASAEAILNLYSNLPQKPKLYLIVKIPYTIDVINSTLKLSEDINSYYLESFLLYKLKADNRSWSRNNKKISGRLQSPSTKDLKKFNINTIPNYKSTRRLINNFPELFK